MSTIPENNLKKTVALVSPEKPTSSQSSRPVSRKSAGKRSRPVSSDKKENVAGLSDAELQELKEIFSLVDKDGGGTISSEELGSLMATLGLKTNKAELQAMVKEIDKDGNGEIDFEEFVAVMSRQVKSTFTPDKLKWAFSQFENVDRKGKVLLNNLVFALTFYCTNKMTQDDAEDLIEQFAPNQDLNTEFDYLEYINLMFNL